ncbi:cytidine deaminase [Fluctibacter corallii]|uniref:cytidine deaminase n=1 Tax=Fluctibacter corallii TaxID=2984329 RepID=UPI00384E9FDE
MDKQTQHLLDAALAAQKNSYSPYSNFKVGAAILANDNTTYHGCNVENASYPLGQCAEAGAISSMVASGATKIEQVLIASPNNAFCPPCGGCRQKIKEFASESTLVHMATQDGQIKTVPFKDLLPLAFEL